MREAVLLVGGRGTRLRPLTINTPKPMLPVAGVPCTAHQIARARAAGVERVILSTSYRAEVFESYFGDGSAHGVELVYVTEDEPLGTGGAIRHVADELRSGPDEPVLIFNGDILSGLDIAGLVDRWRVSSADIALYLTRVDDPRAYGLVPTDPHGRVLAFLEKPERAEDIVTDQINAGCYVFRRSVIDSIPAGRRVSVERETFPQLLTADSLLIGVVDEGYWLDLGTPLAFVRGSCDLVRGIAPSPLVDRSVGGDALILAGATVARDAVVSGGTCVGLGATVSSGASVDASVIFDNATVAEGADVHGSIIGRDAYVGKGARLDGVVVGDGARIGAGNELTLGARVWPDSTLADATIRFSSDH